MDKYRLDSHKLMYHTGRIHKWLSGENIYPIYMEISPAGACNHRCTYCGLDFMGYKPRYLETALLKERLSEMGSLGLKSIMYAGEGEPFLHKDMAELIRHTKASGIDAAVTTNGVLFKRDIADKILEHTEWIKIGIDAATPEKYAKIHNCKEDDFDRVIENVRYATRIKKENGYKCTLGIQMLLLPDNADEAKALAKIAKDIGADYLVIKPYSQHTQSKTKKYSSVKYSEYRYIEDELTGFISENFNIIFRAKTMKKWDNASHNYRSCLGLPFWSYIDAAGNVWGCSVYLGDKRFLYGNIYEETFKDIWEGKSRAESLEWSKEKLDTNQCRVNCRMDDVNQYLWGLKNEPEHVNFI